MCHGARRYDAWNGRFVSKDSDKFIKITRPESLNQYMYCYASPLKYVDPSGNDSYIITINPPNDTDINWDENAETMKRQIEERYEGEIVHIIYISNEDELVNAWNEMGVGNQCGDYNNEKIVDSNISIVVINTHGYYNKAGYGDATPDTVLNDIIDKMDEKKVKGVILGGCNNGHTSYPDNVASYIKEHCDIDEQYIQTMDFVEMLNALESKE